MTPISTTELRRTADAFIEMMRDDLERSFGLGDFLHFAIFKHGDELSEVAVGEFALKHFGNHYDLRRSVLGGTRWSFIPG